MNCVFLIIDLIWSACGGSLRALENVISWIESSVKHIEDASKSAAQAACKNQVSKDVVFNRNLAPTNNREIVRGPWNKECFYVEADKGKQAVILDKKDNLDRVNHLLNNGP